MIHKYTVLFFLTFGIACTIQDAKSEQPEAQAHENSVTAFTADTIEKKKDISDALKYLATYRNHLDTIVNAIEKSASLVTPEQDGLEEAMKLDHVVVDCVHKLGGINVVLPEDVMDDMLEALTECQVDSHKDLAQNPIKSVKDYVAYMNRTYTEMFVAVIAVLYMHYELTDEAIAPYVNPFGTLVTEPEVAPAVDEVSAEPVAA